jgi:hypothetical protein
MQATDQWTKPANMRTEETRLMAAMHVARLQEPPQQQAEISPSGHSRLRLRSHGRCYDGLLLPGVQNSTQTADKAGCQGLLLNANALSEH